MTNDRNIYQFNDSLLFTVDNGNVDFYCPKHRLKLVNLGKNISALQGYKLICTMCKRDSNYTYTAHSTRYPLDSLKNEALALFEQNLYKDAKLIRLDDYYTPEIKKFDALPNSTNYSIKADVKTDKDGDTIVILYVGYKGKKEKAQFFIKPEKLQLSNDHKDLDPAKILAKIELTLKDRNITQNYSEVDNE